MIKNLSQNFLNGTLFGEAFQKEIINQSQPRYFHFQCYDQMKNIKIYICEINKSR